MRMLSTTNALRCTVGASQRYLQVEGEEPVVLVHEEHDPLRLSPGVYEVRRQREYVPQRRARWVAD